MNVNMLIKIHNRFDIEVKDVTTGEIVQKGEAENIVLDSLFTSYDYLNVNEGVGTAIAFGGGTGILDPSRENLFSHLGSKVVTRVEFVFNEPPLPSYQTSKIVLAPSEYVGETITEVGLGSSSSGEKVYTHALIKDSEGNPLSITKTDTQEVTIYATVYATINLEDGLTASSDLLNALACGPGLDNYNYSPYLYLLGSSANASNFKIKSPGFRETGIGRFNTNSANGKIKIGEFWVNVSPIKCCKLLDIDFVTLAQNNSPMWSGYQFQQKEIGIGDGEKTTFDLPWDEAVLDKGYKIYLDGVEQTSGYTFTESQVIFDIAPSQDVEITGDWFVYYIPKDDNHVLDFQFTLSYAEGVPN